MFAKDLGQLLEAHLILSRLVGGVGIFGNTMQRTQFCQNGHFSPKIQHDHLSKNKLEMRFFLYFIVNSTESQIPNRIPNNDMSCQFRL